VGKQLFRDYTYRDESYQCLIAQIAEIKNEWMRQWAKIVLITERGLPPSERLRQGATANNSIVEDESLFTVP
jgi:hypothetical protein